MKLNASSLKSLKVTELKDLCVKNNISVNGKKDELIARLVELPERESKTENHNSIEKNNSSEKEEISDASNLDSLKEVETKQTIEKVADPDESTLNNSRLVSSPSVTEISINKSGDKTDSKTIKLNSSLSSLSDLERARLRAEKFGKTSTVPLISQTNTKTDKTAKQIEHLGSSFDSSLKGSIQPKPQIGSQLASSLSAIASISQDEKLRFRAERFGVSCNSVAKSKTPDSSGSGNNVENKHIFKNNLIVSEDKEKLEARAKRFKLGSGFKEALPPSELEKLAKRAERFGLNKS